MKLNGKKALVTGSSQGIGQAIAFRLAEEGADVVINYHSHPETAEETTVAIRKMGRRSVAIQADIGSAASVQDLVQKSIEALGELNILVNNAGVEKHGSFWEVTEADYDLVLNTNLKGAFFATQAFVRHRMQVKQPGKVINISSVHGALIFVNERTADYLGIPKDHPLRLGIDTGAAWDSHIPFLHPDDHEQTRRVWSTCLRTGSAGEVTFRVRNANARRLDQTCARAGTAV
jgi:hypothetical protein